MEREVFHHKEEVENAGMKAEESSVGAHSKTSTEHTFNSDKIEDDVKKEEVYDDCSDLPSISCDICFKQFKTEQAVRRHKTIHTSDKNCPVCGKTFYSKKVVDVHMRKAHLKESKFSCSYCDFKSDVRQVFDIHVRTHTGEKPNKCQHCEKSFNDPSTLIYHTKKLHTKEGLLNCETCGKGCIGPSELNRHQKTHLKAERNPPTVYSKEFKIFAVQEVEELGMMSASRKHHIEPSSLRRWVRESKKSQSDDGQHTKFCEICGKAFTYQWQLERHQITHSLDHPDKPRSYSNEFKLNAVFEAQKIGVFEAAKKLGIPYRTIGQWVKLARNPHKTSIFCEICGKGLTTATDYKKHLLAHAKGKERPREYSKEFKDEVTTYALGNGIHKTIEKYSISSSSIQKWLKIRKDPLPCDQCDEVFGYKHNLNQHVKSAHAGNEQISNEERFIDFLILNNISEKLKSGLSHNFKDHDKEKCNLEVTGEMENAMEPSLHFLYPEEVKSEVLEEESDIKLNHQDKSMKCELMNNKSNSGSPAELELDLD